MCPTWLGTRLHDLEVGGEQGVDVAARQEAADLAAAAARLPQLPRLQRHAALEQPCRRQGWLVRLRKSGDPGSDVQVRPRGLNPTAIFL